MTTAYIEQPTIFSFLCISEILKQCFPPLIWFPADSIRGFAILLGLLFSYYWLYSAERWNKGSNTVDVKAKALLMSFRDCFRLRIIWPWVRVVALLSDHGASNKRLANAFSTLPMSF